MSKSREEIIAEALGDGGNHTRARVTLDALHRAGWTIQQPPDDAMPLITSLRDRGQVGDADAVMAMALEIDKFRRGWGPSTPTERMQRRADLITVRAFLERVYGGLIELNMDNYNHDDVEEANVATIEAVAEAIKGLKWINDRFQTEFQGPTDVVGNGGVA